MRYFIEFSYKGTSYNGWQKQKNGLGVQELIENALAMVLRTPVELTGSSRTDTGVHAEQQFAHFDLPIARQIPDNLLVRLNGIVPKDIAIRQLYRVSDDLNSRFAASHRRYEYRIIKYKNPFLINQAYQFIGQPDISLMNEAAQKLLGIHDFESFSKVHTQVNNFKCNITLAVWEQQGTLLIFTIQANRFLRGMVRALVGTLLEVGKGKRSVSDFESLIAARSRSLAGPQAPAEGLFLVEVGYPDGLLEDRLFEI